MVVVWVSDFFFETKITATARLAEVHVRVVRTADAFLEVSEHASGALIDAAAADADLIVERVQGLGARPEALPAVVFLAHVERDLASRINEAGGALVLPRSKFAEHLPEILRALGSGVLPNVTPR